MLLIFLCCCVVIGYDHHFYRSPTLRHFHAAKRIVYSRGYRQLRHTLSTRIGWEARGRAATTSWMKKGISEPSENKHPIVLQWIGAWISITVKYCRIVYAYWMRTSAVLHLVIEAGVVRITLGYMRIILIWQLHRGREDRYPKAVSAVSSLQLYGLAPVCRVIRKRRNDSLHTNTCT